MTTLSALTQIRITLLDPDDALLSAATGDLVTYSDLLSHNGDDIQATIRHAAGILAGYWARQPSSVSGGGEGASWSAADRFAFYDRLSKGQGGGGARGTLRGLYVKGATPPMFRRDSLGTDPALEQVPGGDDAA